MDLHSRRSRRRFATALTAATVCLGALAGPALANNYAEGPVYIDTTLRTFYQAPYLTGITTDVNLRWAEDPPHSSRMSINICSNYGYYWARDFADHSTNFHLMTTLPSGTCFVVRGYSLTGNWNEIQELQYQS
jgi:hypothetical protein